LYVLPGCGTVFELAPPAMTGGTWTEKILHSFSDANGDGSMPVAALAISPTGVLFGTTSAGGDGGKRHRICHCAVSDPNTNQGPALRPRKA
jgi:hypothetical protein